MLPTSGGLLNWAELNQWLWEYGYPVRVRVFEKGTLAVSLLVELPEQLSEIEEYSEKDATFYVWRISKESWMSSTGRTRGFSW